MKFTLNGYIFTTNRNFHVHSNVTEGMIKEAIFNEIDNILCLIEQGETNISITHDFGFTIGFAHCVKCPPKFQGVYFSRRGQRPYLSRMVKGVSPQETSLLTIILRFRPSSNTFYIISSWTGSQSKPELGNINYFEHCQDPMKEIVESAEFWLNHALIDEKQKDLILIDN